MNLNDAKIRRILSTPGKHFDGGGLFLLVTDAGGRYWRMKYRFAGKEKTLSFGVYPTVSLKLARERREEAKKTLDRDQDPGVARKAVKARIVTEAVDTFELVAREWHKKTAGKRGDSTQAGVLRWLEVDILPQIGKLPIASLGPRDILTKVVEPIEERESLATARRCLQICGKVFRYAVVTGRCERDVTADLSEAVSYKRTRHHAAITDPKRFGELLRKIEMYTGHPNMRAALQLIALTFVRPGELRGAEWEELDFENAQWNIPGHRMKMGLPHIVPLSTQAIVFFQAMKPFSGGRKHVFTNLHRPDDHMSGTAINKALRAMGYPNNVHTAHGFRATARTIMDEVLGERVDIVEHQLAHLVKDANGTAYNRTAHLPARRVMMQRWADYLDRLRNGADVIPLHGARQAA